VTLRPGAAYLIQELIMPTRAVERTLALVVPPELVEQVAERAAQLVLDSLHDHEPGDASSPYITIPEAAQYLRAKRHRVDDLLSRGTLTRHKDGTRTLILRAELEAYVAGEPTRRAGR
jgi:excisionase family DNA binding protein